MAPRGNKRPTSAVASGPTKKVRVDPRCAPVVEALQGAEGLSEHCRAMLMAIVCPSLFAAEGERHSVQECGVSMIEQVLQDQKTKLIEAVETTRKELRCLESSHSSLFQHLDEAKTSLEQTQAVKIAALSAHADATASTKAAQTSLTEMLRLQTTGDATYAALEQEKLAVDAVYQEHFKMPMDADESPHYSFLKPFIESLCLEDSLISALPSSCVKTKDQRGGFDNLVLTELGKALACKIAALDQRKVDEAAGISERKAKVVAAEAELEAKVLAEKSVAAAFDAAALAQSEAENGVSKASDDSAAVAPRIQEATEKLNLLDAERSDFVDGPLKSFKMLCQKGGPALAEEEAAIAGA